MDGFSLLSVALRVVVGLALVERAPLLLLPSVVVAVPELELAGLAAGLSARPRVRALAFVAAELSARVALDLRFIVLDGKPGCHCCSSPVASGSM